MAIMRCPTCDDAIYITYSVRVGQIITCDSCEELLKVTSIQPVKLQICDTSSDEEEDCIQVPIRPVISKKEKKNTKPSSELPALDDDREELAEERKQEKKKRKQIQRQKIEYFDE
ncbi:MAG: hypothetical protein JEZ00_04955 [Anaerolineaceae bacterium]|nr:hypothetical protein [Anaerolineaceae bacterium]